jgi:hypothetical protein
MRGCARRSLVLLGTVVWLTGCEGDPEAPEGTIHLGNISKSQTWRASDNPHVVKGVLTVMGPDTPVLTLEAGVEVRFEKWGGMVIGDDTLGPGELRAEGTAAAPILLTAHSDTPKPGDWQGVTLHGRDSGSSTLSHVTIEYAGGIPTDLGGSEEFWKKSSGGLRLRESHVLPEAPRTVRVRDVTVRKSQNHGVFLVNAGFTSDSQRLSSLDNEGVALTATANEVGTIPADSTLRGNTINALQVFDGEVRVSQTWPALGVPYQLVRSLDDNYGGPLHLRVAAESAPTLTLSPGTEFQMPAGSAIMVGDREWNADTILPGMLRAQGTAEKPIRFIPATATPAPGFWSGLFFYGPSGSVLNHVTVTHAGQPFFGTERGGNVNVLRDQGLFVTNSHLSDSAGCGVVSRLPWGELPDDLTQASLGNVFARNADGAQCESERP